GLAVTALQVRHHALEAMPALVPGTALGDVGEGDLVLATTEQHRLPHVLGQLVPGRVDVEAVVPGQRLDELEVVRVAPVPAAYGAGRQGQLGMHHHAAGVEVLGHAQPVAGRARTRRGVEGEQPRLQVGQRVVADRAAV